ncbi:MAG: cell wall-active antibiotics response protein [Gemmatimonadaceae bacterium]|nr:cell wall-active antibiotics response protein [Gemmatimonadaceae bacterium]
MPSPTTVSDLTPRERGSVLPPGELRLLGLFENVRRRGPWVVEPRTLVRAVFSDVVLDLREAMVPGQCVIDVGAYLAEVKIIVPPELHVTMDVTTVIAEAKEKRRGEPPSADPTAAAIHVTGTACLAEVKVVVRRHDES